ncbi:hypothetical protein BpHYR1_038026 [Brachionus plicatilis]|uniref:Uncharacterized protein n=1 Tax=Brachionus plicatilis TaxID=10195 RepID=A0A3M7R6M5_BRAPC|nr:hypothetical protein BpHYR1_038026 [Brachionus plicatilis]
MPNPPQVEQMKKHNLHLKQIRAILQINPTQINNHFNKNTPLYQSDMPEYLGKSSGRPYGGQCWFLDDCTFEPFPFKNQGSRICNFWGRDYKKLLFFPKSCSKVASKLLEKLLGKYSQSSV